jgi:hypothetical protein
MNHFIAGITIKIMAASTPDLIPKMPAVPTSKLLP